MLQLSKTSGPRTRAGIWRTPLFAVAASLGVLAGAASEARAAQITVEVEALQRAAEPVRAEVAVDGEPPRVELVDAPGSAVFADVEDGTRDVTVSAPGFDSESVSVLADGDVSLHVRLYPAADVALAGVVSDAAGAVVAGAELTLSGSRMEGPRVVTSGSDGSYVFDAVPAGIYDLEVRFESAPAIRRADVRLLGDATVDVQLPNLAARPDVREFRRPLCSSAPAGSGLGVWVALVALARRRR